MILCTWNSWKKKTHKLIYSVRNEMRGCLGLGAGDTGIKKWQERKFWDDGHIFYFDYVGYTVIYICQIYEYTVLCKLYLNKVQKIILTLLGKTGSKWRGDLHRQSTPTFLSLKVIWFLSSILVTFKVWSLV